MLATSVTASVGTTNFDVVMRSVWQCGSRDLGYVVILSSWLFEASTPRVHGAAR